MGWLRSVSFLHAVAKQKMQYKIEKAFRPKGKFLFIDSSLNNKIPIKPIQQK